jgi:hypothetical protein
MLAASPTWADDLTFYVSADAAARVGPTGQGDFHDFVQVPPVTAGVIVDPTGPDSASGNAAADFGSLTAFAAASSADGILALGRGDAEWSDTFIATSSDPSVTHITFVATVSLWDSIDASDNVQGSAQAGLFLFDATHGLGDSPIASLEDATFLPPLEDRTVTVMFTEPVGVPFRLVGVLLADAETGDQLGGEGVVVVDASGGATFNLDPITSEGGYTTASGFSYLSSP